MFLSRNKKNNAYPCKPQFYYIKVGFKGIKIIEACFRDANWTIHSDDNQGRNQDYFKGVSNFWVRLFAQITVLTQSVVIDRENIV